MYHISLHHDAFGVEGAEFFDGTISQAKRKATSMQRLAGHGWRAVIRTEQGDPVAVRYPGARKWTIV